MRTFLARFCPSLAAAICISAAGLAQMPTTSQPGPIPPALTTSKTIFVSNAGSDSGLFPSPFTGDPDRPYTEFYAALKATGNYTLTGDPAQADLVLELRLFAPNGPSDPNKVAGASDPLPMFRLVVYDRKTHYILWAVTQSIAPVVGQKAHDKNFDSALNQVLNQFLEISGKPLAGAP
jgi:hypothetical protein